MRAPYIWTAGLAGAVLLSGCTTNTTVDPDATDAAGVITVSSTADSCDVSTDTAVSGVATFRIANDSGQTTEFYLLGSDGLRVVGEKENIAAGTTAELTVTVQPGEYFTACKPGMSGANVGETAFTVTGDEIELSAEDAELQESVVTDYVNFVKNEVAELVPATEELVAAYIAGDDDAARELFPYTRVHYERIEPIAEALGILDARIDYREIDYKAEAEVFTEDDPTFTEWLGYHRIEKDLWEPGADDIQPDGSSALDGWAPSTQAERERIGETLVADVQKLYDLVHAEDFVETQQLDIATVSNGASALLEEVAVNKVTGEEDWWSHTDLYDFAANVEGARVAFDLVAPIAEAQGDEQTELIAEIETEFDALDAALAEYGSLDEGFVFYDTVTRDQQRDLSARIDAVREPLSRLTAAVLGVV